MIVVGRCRRKCQAAPVSVIALVALVFVSAGCLSLPTPGAVSPIAPSPAQSRLDLTIVHSNDTWGYLTPCG
jgi:hypothetical protein